MDHDDATCPTCLRWRDWREPFRDTDNPNAVLLPPVADWPDDVRDAFDHWREHHPLA